VLMAHHLPKLGAHLVTALARLIVINLARRSKIWRCGARGRKRAEGAEKRQELRGSLARETGNGGGALA
jgi:hypothetical protein